jgi:hypothetical protein
VLSEVVLEALDAVTAFAKRFAYQLSKIVLGIKVVLELYFGSCEYFLFLFDFGTGK